MDSLTKSRPIGITIIAILVWLYALIMIILGVYVIMAVPSDVTNNPLINQLRSMVLLVNGYGSIIGGVVLGIIGIFLWKGKRWAKIVLGVFIWANILGGTSIPILIISLGIFIYLFFFTRFIFQYYYRLPIEENDTFFFQDKIATNYIRALERVEPSVKVVWVTPSPKFTFYRFIFFGDYYKNSFDIKKINLRLASQDYSFGNVLFQSECPKEFSKDSLYLVDATMKCRLADPSAIVANINDAGVKYQLSRDPLCAGFGHRRYPLIKEFNLLRVESLSIKDFCDNYVISDQLP